MEEYTSLTKETYGVSSGNIFPGVHYDSVIPFTVCHTIHNYDVSLENLVLGQLIIGASLACLVLY